MKFMGALVLAIATAFVPGQQSQQADPPTKVGWWVRVNTAKTEASSITLQVGTKKEDRRDWRVWRSDETTEFDVPRDFQQVAELYLQGSSNPKGKTTRFCLFYQSVGVKQFDFSGDVELKIKKTERDDSCK